MFNKIYELPICEDYVRHWGVVEAIRELLQNALDSESPLEYHWTNTGSGEYSLSIASKYSSLAPKTLLLGLTSKAEAKDKIGSFGEGYKIAMLVLVRDRQTVDSFDLLWLTKDMWFETDLHEEIAQLMADQAKDLSYADHGTPHVIKEACYQHFKKNHPGAVLAKSQKELETMIEKGMTKVVYLGNTSYTATVLSNKQYAHAPDVQVMPTEALSKWFSDHLQYMRTPAIVSFKQIIRDSAEWRLK